MDDGYIKLYRKLRDHSLWKEKPFTKGQAWVDILLNTSFKPSEFWVRGICVKTNPGQCAMSQLTMAKRWGWSRKKVQNFLKYLEKEHQIEQQKNNVTSLIYLKNWGEHQDRKHQTKQEKSTKRAPKEHNKECKECKEENILSVFEEVWKQYPERDGNKKKTLEKITKQLSNGRTPENLQAALKNYLSYVQSKRSGGFPNLQYKNRQTWFNNWEDWLDYEAPKQKSTYKAAPDLMS